MALAEDPRSIYVPEVGQAITFFYAAFFRSKMSGLFTLKIFYKQHGDVDKVGFPYAYIFTSIRDTTCSFYDVANINVAMVTASVRTNLQWLLKSFSAALIWVHMSASSVNEFAHKLKSSSIAGNYA